MAPLLNLVTVTVVEAQPPVARVAAGVARKGHGVAFSVIMSLGERPHVNTRKRWEMNLAAHKLARAHTDSGGGRS